MEQKKDRKILKRIGAIVCAIAVAIVAFVVPFSAKYSPKINSKNMTASADEVVSGATEFLGSSYCVTITGNQKSYNSATGFGYDYPFNGVANVSYGFRFDDSGNMVVTVTLSDVAIVVDTGLGSGNRVNYAGPYYATQVCLANTNAFNEIVFRVEDTGAFISDLYLKFAYQHPLGFNLDLLSFSITSAYSDVACSTDFSFNDNTGHTFVLAWYNDLSYFNIPNSFIYINYSMRTYYFSDALSDSEFYQSGYNEGSSYGYSQGYSAGETAGYNNGYKAGETIGYNNGYSQGVETGGKFTFFSLISAVIDAPIQAFMGLFNFELLGINLAGFFTGLLTLAFIITIVRLVMP